MLGSEMESRLARTKGLAMLKQLGKSHVYMTICPDSPKSLTVWQWGKKKEELQHLEQQLNEELEKFKDNIKHQSSKDPNACAHWIRNQI